MITGPRIHLFFLSSLLLNNIGSSWSSYHHTRTRSKTILRCKRCDNSSPLQPSSGESITTTAREARIIKPFQEICRSVGITASLSWLNGLAVQPAFAEQQPSSASEILAFDNNIEKYFPSVVEVKSLPSTIKRILPGFTKSNTLLCTSVCSDTANYDFVKELESKYGSAFNLGGLAGVPFVGPSGMEEVINNIPKQGKMLIVVASHVGLLPSKAFQLGKVKYRNKETVTCNFAIDALSNIEKNIDSNKAGIDNLQENYIIQQLQKNKPNDFNKKNKEANTAWVTYELFHIAQERIRDILYPLILSQKISTKNIAILGGIVINKGDEGGGTDLFQPILFEVDGKNMFSEAFDI